MAMTMWSNDWLKKIQLPLKRRKTGNGPSYERRAKCGAGEREKTTKKRANENSKTGHVWSLDSFDMNSTWVTIR